MNWCEKKEKSDVMSVLLKPGFHWPAKRDISIITMKTTSEQAEVQGQDEGNIFWSLCWCMHQGGFHNKIRAVTFVSVLALHVITDKV